MLCGGGRGRGVKSEACDGGEEPGDFVETHCHWKECDREFPTQDDLVKVDIIYIKYCSQLRYSCVWNAMLKLTHT